jgi:hypothetical protein
VIDDEWDTEDTAELDLLATDELEQLTDEALCDLQSADVVDDEVSNDADDAGFDPYNHA